MGLVLSGHPLCVNHNITGLANQPQRKMFEYLSKLARAPVYTARRSSAQILHRRLWRRRHQHCTRKRTKSFSMCSLRPARRLESPNQGAALLLFASFCFSISIQSLFYLKNLDNVIGILSRRLVHRDGDYHRSVHVWIYSESTQELLLQRRADCKDSWPGLWDISSAGHISAGDSSLITAR
ncbi:Nudix hydrolase 3 [Platanthera guangdongensis]|uniref:Nudix hydrolase 3 n=1 Tax=Platanthera guangdongensis TaxID=2320717 RepID=A0ABR2MPC1_9ASPA